MHLFEIGTGFTSIPAKIGAATEIVVENLIHSYSEENDITLIDIQNSERSGIQGPVSEIKMPDWLMHPGSFLSVKHKLKRIFYSIKLACRVRQLIRQQPEAFFHFHNQYNFAFSYFICFLFREKSASTRLVYTLHTPLWSQSMEEIHSQAKKRYFLEIYSIKRADIVIALNSGIKENLQTFLGKSIRGNLTVIPNGVDTGVYHPEKSERIYPLSFISIGSVCERKNQLQTLQILHPALLKYNLHYYFAGAIADNAYMEKIRQFIRENRLEQHVTFLGELSPGEELNRAYNLADIYISNSQSEAFSLVILEAMAAGLPLLLSESFLTSIKDAPPAEAITFCQTSEDFIRQIERFLLDNETLKELSAQAAEYVNRNYSWKYVAQLHESVFKSINYENSSDQ